MRCRSCGYDNRADSVYCGQCRAALARPCPACGEPAPVGAEACPTCGASLTGTVPPAGAAWQGAPGESAAPWQGAPGEPAAVYDPVDLAGAGTAGQSHWVHGGETRFTGVARDVQQRQDEHLITVDFRIERYDPSGNRLAPVPVEMRGTVHGFSGRVSNGDEIRVVEGEWRHGTLRVRELDNLTTGARVRSSRYTEAQMRRAQIGFLAVPLVMFAAFTLLAVHSGAAWVAIFPLGGIAFVAFRIVASRRSRD